MKLLGVIKACTMIWGNFITAFSVAAPRAAAAAGTWELCPAGRGKISGQGLGTLSWPWEDQRCQRLLQRINHFTALARQLLSPSETCTFGTQDD